MDDPPLSTTLAGMDATTDRARMDQAEVLELLKSTHWADGLAAGQVNMAMRNSLCFAVLESETLVAFGRAVTDRSTFAYLTDIVVAKRHRSKGLGRALVGWMLDHPDLAEVRRVTLLTRDAARLYASFGFTEGSTLTYMEKAGRQPPR